MNVSCLKILTNLFLFFLILAKTAYAAKQLIVSLVPQKPPKTKHNTATGDQGKQFFFFSPNDDTNYVTLFTRSAVMDVRVSPCIYMYIYVFSIVEVEFFLQHLRWKKEKKKMPLSVSVQREEAAPLVVPLAWLASVKEQHHWRPMINAPSLSLCFSISGKRD